VIDGVKTKKAKVKIKKIDKKNNKSYVELTITEGRNHQVKNMFSSLGYNVVRLKRTSYAFLNLRGIKIGEYRTLTIKEVKQLYALTK
ncbi:MAG: pseudouridine synthase, partial [Tenericutes bacterium]|nr:pseudouridine synthase [Mycoplasmatota bacterium]